MQNTDAFERDWHDRGLGCPLHREMTFTQAGLVLGRGTLLAEFEKKGPAHGLAFDGKEARIFSLLTAAYREPLAGGAIEKIRRAGEFWRAGEKALAQIHLAFMGLPKIDEADAYRLFLAGTALEKGVSPSDLMKALGFRRAARDIEKYNPDQPRVPAESGRESGQWTSGEREKRRDKPLCNASRFAWPAPRCRMPTLRGSCQALIMKEFNSSKVLPILFAIYSIVCAIS
jgi:hypothetical protein